MKRFWPISILLSGILIESCNNAPGDHQNKMGNKSAKHTAKIDSSAIKSRLNDYNVQFVVDAAHASWAKLFLGRLASNRGSSQVVRTLGKTMIRDHSRENKLLIALAEAEKITMPRVMGSQQQRFLDTLSLKEGSAFDKAYVNYLIEMYQKEIAYFEEGIEKLTRPAVKAFANQVLPMLRRHLVECEAVRKQL